jgi:hypothetical protein
MSKTVVSLLLLFLQGFYYGVNSFQSVYRRDTTTMSISMPETNNKLKFDLGKIAFSLIPLSPESAGRRKTLLQEIVKGKIWTLDQLQGVINVNGKEKTLIYNI